MPETIRQTVVSYRGIAEGLEAASRVGEEGLVPGEVAANALISTAVAAAARAVDDPRRRAELLAQVAQALRDLENESAEIDGDVMVAPQSEPASLLQSFVASGEAADSQLVPAEAAGEELKFATNDLFGWFFSLFRWLDGISRHPLLRPESASPEAIGRDARFAVVGDWGTGMYGAPVVAKSIENDPRRFDVLLHLGDVYYAGTRSEVQERFLDVWPRRGDAISRAINSNHEMYSGGHAYFGITLPAFGQASSYFALQNDHWTVVGLDTAYVDHAIDETQEAWLKEVVEQAGPRKIILFSHHQLFSRLDNQGPRLASALAPLLTEGRIHLWYWGHEHRCVIYDQHPQYRLLARCIGHGGIPYSRKPVQDAEVVEEVEGEQWRALPGAGLVPACRVLDGPNQDITRKGHKYGPHGYLVLEFDGPEVRELVHSARGKLLYRNTVS